MFRLLETPFFFLAINLSESNTVNRLLNRNDLFNIILTQHSPHCDATNGQSNNLLFFISLNL